MKLSTRSRYGTRLMLDLGEHYGAGFVQLGEIAKRQSISLKYLEQIIIPLKKAGFVRSARGAGGGYQLTKPPHEITIGEIVALLEGGDEIAGCSRNPEVCERSAECVTRGLWQDTAKAMYERLNAVTLSELLARGSTALGGSGCGPDNDTNGSGREQA